DNVGTGNCWAPPTFTQEHCCSFFNTAIGTGVPLVVDGGGSKPQSASGPRSGRRRSSGRVETQKDGASPTSKTVKRISGSLTTSFVHPRGRLRQCFRGCPLHSVSFPSLKAFAGSQGDGIELRPSSHDYD
ncbi:unnamed protein product, partial [Amoebophrya sp. A25]